MNAERERDWPGIIAAVVVAGVAFWLYLATMAPTVATVFDDSLEFALVAQRWAIPHQTGYPLYAIAIGLAAHLLPIGEVAWRVHLVSGLAGAATVGTVVLLARRLDLSLAAAGWAGHVLATAGTFWAQARIAEVYTLHLLLVALLLVTLLRWADRPAQERGLPLWTAVVFGLGLAHHRTILLWVPAVLLFIWWTDTRAFRPQRGWLRLLGAVLAPLLLYAYLPLRAEVGSLNGAYRHTGFLRWVFATQYSVFLTENPFDQVHDAAFYRELFLHQFSWVTIVIVAIGVVWLARRRLRNWTLLMLGAATNAGFAAVYRVADVEVFWLPVVLVGAVLAGAGLDAVLRSLRVLFPGERNPTRPAVGALLVLLLVVAHVPRWQTLRERVDLSDAWAAAAFAEDALGQPLPENATIVGILGETTLLRYWQEVHGVRPNVRTVAADTEEERLDAVEAALADGVRPFLTRPLAGAERWHLDAQGPLIAVDGQPDRFQGTTYTTIDENVEIAVAVTPVQTRGPARQRVTVLWQVDQAPGTALKASARLRTSEGEVLAQVDCTPVHDAYPSTAWSSDEEILDAIELPALDAGTEIELVVYRAEDGSSVGNVVVPAVAPERAWQDPDVGTCTPAYRLEG